MRQMFAASVITAALLMVLAPAVLAAPPVGATIDVTAELGADGTFTAVSAVLCASGTTSDVATASGNAKQRIFHDLKTFTCSDSSGTFTLRITAKVKYCDPTDHGTWSVVGGTGDYAGLRGHGRLVGTYDTGDSCTATSIVDHLTGMLH